MNQKALFLCRGHRTVLMADLADHLKCNGTIDSSAAFYIGDPTVHENTLQQFDKLYHDLDIFSPDLSSVSTSRINQLRDRYDQSLYLWNALYAERALVQVEQDIHSPPHSYHPQKGEALIIKALHYADLTLSDASPSFVFDISALGLQRIAFYAAANFHNVPFFLLGHSHIGERYTIYDDLHYSHASVSARYKDLTKDRSAAAQTTDGWKVLRDLPAQGSIYVGHQAATPSTDKSSRDTTLYSARLGAIIYRLNKSFRFFRKLASTARKTIHWNKAGLINYVDDRERFWQAATRPIAHRYRRRKNKKTIENKLYDNFPAAKIKDKILFTWHVQPEQSTSQLAPFHVNQEVAVQNIARVAPLDSIIVVKPHPHTLGNVRPTEFKLLSDLPNVYFTKAETSTTNLIPYCSAIVTLTGTSGMEALALGRPTFYLGTPSWRICESATYCATYDELGRRLRDLEKHSPQLDDVASYFQAIIDNSEALPNGKKAIREPLTVRNTASYRNVINSIASLIHDRLRKDLPSLTSRRKNKFATSERDTLTAHQDITNTPIT